MSRPAKLLMSAPRLFGPGRAEPPPSPPRSREQNRKLLFAADIASIAQLEQPRESRGPRGVDVDVRHFAGEPVRLDQPVLIDRDRPAAGFEQAAQHSEPVVRLVVQDAMGDALRLLLPRPHERRTMRGRVPELLL